MKPETKKGKVPGREAAPPKKGASKIGLPPDDGGKLKRLLAPLLKDIGARWVLLVDMDGQPIAQYGEPGRFDLRALAPVIASSFAAMKHIARHFGGEFSVMLNHGRRDNVQLSIVGDKMILAIVFGNQAPLGTARLCAQHVTRKLEALLPKAAPAKGGLKPEFVDAVKARLDELLG
jgi:predicted regulator of Ras-like GTPase activity (Roadblock/LC7/MglB family)